MAEDLGNWERTHYSSDITQKDDGDAVIIMGWLRAIRGGGNLVFLQLADREGTVQITAKKGIVLPKLFKKIGELERESVLAVKGTVKKNKEAPNGFEIIPMEIKVLNHAEAPLPMEVVTKKTPAELPTRLDSRFMDLRKPEIAAIFDVADTLKISFMSYLDRQEFININPPVIIGAASEGGAELFPVKYFDKEVFLNQSPQLYKQILMATGFDRVSIVTPVFRAEPHDTPRHLNESIQMDIEIAFIRDENDVLDWYDRIIPHMIGEVKKRCKDSLGKLGIDLEVPDKIKRITYDKALELLKKKGVKIKWGDDLTPEAERAICELHNPVVITKWPTALRAFYSMPEPGNPKICRAYDVLYNGIEISSGAQRIHSHDDLLKTMKRKKMDPKGFKFYLDAFKFGMPPHGGFSIGLERLTMAVLNLSTIKEATLFPRTKERVFP